MRYRTLLPHSFQFKKRNNLFFGYIHKPYIPCDTLATMKILIATPLYPPEIAPVARYVKELARRLSEQHEITILAYGHMPEKIEGVSIIAIDKHAPRIVRLTHFFTTLLRTRAEYVYAINGISVEIPLFFFSFFKKTPFVFCIGDSKAATHAERSVLFGFFQKRVCVRARHIIDTIPLERPEILPLEPHPQKALQEWEASWNTHIANLTEIFTHGKS